jgi:hypothetical protein
MEPVSSIAVRNIDRTRTPHLYHYQSFDVERLTPILLESKLYFSRPSSFNDPWDCRLCYDLTQLADATTRARVAADFIRIDRQQNQGRNAAHYNALANDAARTSGDRLPRFIRGERIAPYLGRELMEKLDNPLIFQGPPPVANSSPPMTVHGYDVTILIDVCKAIIQAETDGEASNFVDTCRGVTR